MTPALHIAQGENWLPQDEPVLIAGPCSVESPEQVLKTAQSISSVKGFTYLRGGIWKPRTRPNSFEGVGDEGLKWLKDAGNEVGVPVATEVANAAHVEACLKNDIDVLWVGARTTVNPFSVQEIADALKGVKVPVFIKNPITPDINLWIGALERINAAGITQMGAIHRGFSSYDKSSYRNTPMWELPIQLKIMFPDLPLLCDPSHIAGERSLLGRVSQKAMDMDMDGLMIESHFDPSMAKSDAEQQVTPSDLEALMGGLQLRTNASSNKEFKANLEQLRAEIDEVDEALIHKFAERLGIVEKIGEYKKANQVTILQLERWEQVIKERSTMAGENGISDTFIKKLLELIHQESIRIQTEVMNK